MASTKEGLTDPETLRAGLAEFLATMLFVFLGVGTVAVLGGATDPTRHLAISFAHGLAIMLLVTATANLSGGHINPAVTFGAWITGKISLTKGVVYIVAQLVGGIVGALLVAAVIPDTMSVLAHGLGAGVSAGQGLLAEIILTFVLVGVVFATAIDPKGRGNLAPVAIGLAVLVDHLVGVPLTGASMNPARSLAPAIVAGEWANHWIYWVGPLAGGALAAVIYDRVYLRRS